MLGFKWLHDAELYYMFHSLTSLKPCAVQSLPLTENQKEWGNVLINTVFDVTGARDDGTTLFEIHHALGRYVGGVIPFFVLIFLLIQHAHQHAYSNLA